MDLFDLLTTCAGKIDKLNLWQYQGKSDDFKRDPDYSYVHTDEIDSVVLSKPVICWYYKSNGNLCVVLGG